MIGRCASMTCVSIVIASLSAMPVVRADEIVYLQQGPEWTSVARADFYTRDQGSRLIPAAWLEALEQPNGVPFLADQLERYGYLPNPGNVDGLPVGFTKNDQYVGLNCAACHTRQINVESKEYRIDGGPAIVDAQSLFEDLSDAVEHVLASDENFLVFAKKVLGPPRGPADLNPNDVVHLKEAVQAWQLRFDTIMSGGLPNKAWGPGRMDAVGMIFNRLTGLDIGPPPSYIIADNIKPADAPVRYPFLWNAAKQDKTQWPGFADNGSDILGLVRNLGEVYGVFADFHPKEEWWRISGVDFLDGNSANFDGLRRLEDLIQKIGPPKYPWSVDRALAAEGKRIYQRSTDAGGCIECHGIKPGETRFFDNKTWATPIMDVGTDSREYEILGWTAKTGVLQDKHIPLLTDKLKATDTSFNILRLSIIGSIIQHETSIFVPTESRHFATQTLSQASAQTKEQLRRDRSNFQLPTSLQDLKGAMTSPSDRKSAALSTEAESRDDAVPPEPRYRYESRVLEGIWATAPYLHNGSVPTLADLLEPVNKRPREFKIGPNYDTERLGLATEQSKFGDQTLKTTPTDRNSGNSNCGHEYGTSLTPDEKKSLLEYLKVL